MTVKLTDKNGQTRGGMQWGEGVRHHATGKGKELCSDGWIHCYKTPEQAILFNCIGANFYEATMLLWEFKGEGEHLEVPDKLGFKAGTTLRQIPKPVITLEKRIEIAIRCAQRVFGGKSEIWDEWARKWLSGEDRAQAAGATARAAAEAAGAAAEAAAWAAEAAAWAAEAAARATARAAAEAAAEAARAAEAVKTPDLQGIILGVLKEGG